MATKIKIKATKEDFESGTQDLGEFVVPKPGYYTLTLKEANPGFSKDSDGNPDKKRPRIECIYEITGVGVDDEPVTENYGNIWDYVTFGERSGFSRGRFLVAMGVTDGTKDYEGEVDLDELIGTKVTARLRREVDRNRKDDDGNPIVRARIASLLPFGSAGKADDDAFGATTEVEEEPFGAAGGDEGDEDEPYTEEFLNGIDDLKELGAIAEEFDLNPRDSIVKTPQGKVSNAKTKAKLIKAILEAQDAAEGGGAGGDDEDPF